jgi:aryl sulfotransferase
MARESMRPRSTPTRAYRNHHLDSTRWDGYQPRPGDIVVTTPYKSGTTWMLQIVGSLVLWPNSLTGGVRHLSPWIDARFDGPIEPILEEFEERQHRRFIKSHLAADGVPIWDELSYIVVGRDPRDVFMSLWNHYSGHTDDFFDFINDPDRPGDPFPRPPEDPRVLWQQWATRGWFPWESDGWPYWSHSHHFSSWWALRRRPNVLFVHFNDLLDDLDGEMRRVAAFLGVSIGEEAWPQLVDGATFRSMKDEAQRLDAERGDRASSVWRDGIATFFHKGTNGRWRDVLSDADLTLYDEMAGRLDPPLRTWLEEGRHGCDPRSGG